MQSHILSSSSCSRQAKFACAKHSCRTEGDSAFSAGLQLRCHIYDARRRSSRPFSALQTMGVALSTAATAVPRTEVVMLLLHHLHALKAIAASTLSKAVVILLLLSLAMMGAVALAGQALAGTRATHRMLGGERSLIAASAAVCTAVTAAVPPIRSPATGSASQASAVTFQD